MRGKMRNVRILVLLFVLAFAILAFIQPRWETPPAKDGAGPLAVHLDSRLVAPEYHSPIEAWRTHHMDMVNSGDFNQSQCLRCHDVSKSCNNCHNYVGVPPIAAPSP
jgi:hypothetical protein